MLLLSADDVLAPWALARGVAAMEANDRIGFVIGRSLVHFVEESELQAGISAAEALRDAAPLTVRSGASFIREVCAQAHNPVAASGVVVRTALQKQSGGYLPTLPHAGDLEMWLRLAARADLGIVDAPQCFTRIHAHNMRHDYSRDRNIGDLRQKLLAFETFFAQQSALLEDAPALERLARRMLAEEALWTAAHCFEEGDDAAAARLMAVAQASDRSVTGTPLWWKTVAKRAMGAPMRRLVGSALEAVRGGGAKRRHPGQGLPAGPADGA
jgi:hypothetical protein